MSREYRSKIDTWLIVVLGGSIAIALLALYIEARDNPSEAMWIAVLTLAVRLAIPLHLLMTARYELDAQHLVVRSGFFK